MVYVRKLPRPVYIRKTPRPRRPGTREQPQTLVWYVTPFAEPEWMDRSKAENVLRHELIRYAQQSDRSLPAPHILERHERVQELARRTRKKYPKLVDLPQSTGALKRQLT